MARIQRTASRPQRKTSGEVKSRKPLVGILGGSKSDFPVLEKSGAILDELGIPYELLVVSAHRTPDRLFEYATSAHGRGIEVIIAGAGGAAHLPGMLASKTHLPVIGVPIPTENLRGLDPRQLSGNPCGGQSRRTSLPIAHHPILREWSQVQEFARSHPPTRLSSTPKLSRPVPFGLGRIKNPLCLNSSIALDAVSNFRTATCENLSGEKSCILGTPDCHGSDWNAFGHLDD